MVTIIIVGLVFVFGLPLMIGLIDVVTKHKQRMAELHASGGTTSEAFEKLREEYQEFVLGSDARIHRLEERIRTLESKQRQAGEYGEVRRG